MLSTGIFADLKFSCLSGLSYRFSLISPELASSSIKFTAMPSRPSYFARKDWPKELVMSSSIEFEDSICSNRIIGEHPVIKSDIRMMERGISRPDFPGKDAFNLSVR
jgi:hypothetical protein